MMDWAALHARSRGAETWWKSFTTGKTAKTLGGIPHDTYGMTSLSIRQYVLGIYKQLGLKEAEITKVQTGGPGKSITSIITRCFSQSLNIIQMVTSAQVSNTPFS